MPNFHFLKSGGKPSSNYNDPGDRPARALVPTVTQTLPTQPAHRRSSSEPRRASTSSDKVAKPSAAETNAHVAGLPQTYRQPLEPNQPVPPPNVKVRHLSEPRLARISTKPMVACFSFDPQLLQAPLLNEVKGQKVVVAIIEYIEVDIPGTNGHQRRFYQTYPSPLNGSSDGRTLFIRTDINDFAVTQDKQTMYKTTGVKIIYVMPYDGDLVRPARRMSDWRVQYTTKAQNTDAYPPVTLKVIPYRRSSQVRAIHARVYTANNLGDMHKSQSSWRNRMATVKEQNDALHHYRSCHNNITRTYLYSFLYRT